MNLADGDGTSDREESVAGTDPTDIDALLKIASISATSTQATILWRARSGVQYEIRAADPSVTNAYSSLGSTNTVGGSAPWFVVTNSFTDTGDLSADRRFYVIRVVE